ncbi:hypothetical protein BVY02_00995 [bacterium J17]|nr:hypothetical protein BVY02_00995 [bacterium J17]
MLIRLVTLGFLLLLLSYQPTFAEDSNNFFGDNFVNSGPNVLTENAQIKQGAIDVHETNERSDEGLDSDEPNSKEKNPQAQAESLDSPEEVSEQLDSEETGVNQAEASQESETADSDDSWDAQDITAEDLEKKPTRSRAVETVTRAQQAQESIQILKENPVEDTAGQAPDFNQIRRALEAARDQRLDPKKKPQHPKKTRETLEKF